MTHDEATARCEELNRSSEQHWMVRETADGDWQVVRTSLPSRSPVHATTAEKAQTPPQQDPRPAYEQNIGGPYGPG